MPFDITNIQSEAIIFGGLTLGLLAMIWLVRSIVRQYGNHTNDVINRNTDAWIKNSSTNQQLTDVIEKWHAFGQAVIGSVRLGKALYGMV